ncbi:hypothetical protein ACRQ5Q_07280 [Bradyrhizobium sp. PMVTL-01]|uniref:hypothetical protein n=1 Tax=Bradyrhizobium sp. PMVTL-01 TaxID=3434999 RepID=UPI003F6F2894
MSKIDHEHRNLIEKIQKGGKAQKPKIARAAIPGEREGDLERLQETKRLAKKIQDKMRRQRRAIRKKIRSEAIEALFARSHAGMNDGE